MRPYILQRTQHVSAPLDQVWAYFATPENLQKITPPWLNMEILTPSPVTMKDGAVFDYVVTMRGMPLRWTSIIAEYAPPNRFVDVQLRGPYAFWHHAHEFIEAESGITEIKDTVAYLLPFGPLGRIAHATLVKRDLEKIFNHRIQVVARQFGKAPQTSF